jgi:hypothetical protein
LFVRGGTSGQPDTNDPPRYTNQIYYMSISNVFGTEAWNSAMVAYTNTVTIITSNQISIILTNNYDW